MCRPANAAYKDEIIYRVTTANGIDSPLAAITETHEGGGTLRSFGDGEFYLRAMCKNGTDCVRMISQVKLTAQGLGCALTDPYGLVEGGLHGLGGGDVTTGLGHGAGFGVGGGWIGFENVDFGMAGSDTFTVSVYSNSNTPVMLRVFDGAPDDGGTLIGEFEYGLKPIWQVYQSAEYKLSRPLRGVHTLCFVSDSRLDIGSFVFERRSKETAELPAASAENIYGDAFTIEGETVTGIGNNVTLDLGEFDFGKAPEKLHIKGRSELPVSSIHVLFTDGTHEKRILCEFEGSLDYTVRTFVLTGISGRQRVQLAFLPGSRFDLASVRFE